MTTDVKDHQVGVKELTNKPTNCIKIAKSFISPFGFFFLNIVTVLSTFEFVALVQFPRNYHLTSEHPCTLMCSTRTNKWCLSSSWKIRRSNCIASRRVCYSLSGLYITRSLVSLLPKRLVICFFQRIASFSYELGATLSFRCNHFACRNTSSSCTSTIYQLDWGAKKVEGRSIH